MLRLTHLVHGRSWVREPVSLVYNQATKEGDRKQGAAGRAERGWCLRRVGACGARVGRVKKGCVAGRVR